jgi:hypothetical protein
MAQVIGVSSLEYEGKVTGLNQCLWKGPHVDGQYSNLLEVEVTAKPEAAFFYAEEQAKQDAAKRGYSYFGTIGTRGAPMFFESYAVTDASLPPCQPPGQPPGQPPPTLNEFGPPTCNPEPPWFSITVDSYGRLNPHGPEAFVSVDLAGEVHVSKPEVIALNRKILAGQIR